MAERKILADNTPQQVIPQSQNFSGFMVWAETMAKAGSMIDVQIENYQVREAKNKAIEDSTARDEDGKLTFTTNQSGSKAGIAYNQAGIQAYHATLNSDIQNGIAEMASRNALNPNGYQKELAKFKKETLASVKKNTPEIYGSVVGDLERLGQAHLRAIALETQKKAMIVAKDAVETQTTTLTQGAVAAIQNDPDQSEAIKQTAINREKYLNLLLKNLDKEAHPELAKDFPELGKKDPNRTGIYSVAKVNALMKEYDKTVAVELYSRGMKKALGTGNGGGFLSSVYSAKMPDTVKQEVVKRLFKDLSDANKIEAQKERDENTLQEAHYKSTEVEVTDAYISGTLDDETLKTYNKLGIISPTLARSLHNHIVKGDTEHSDKNALLELELRDINDVTFEEIVGNNGLSTEDKTKWVERKKTAIERGKNWKSSVLGKQAIEEIKNRFNLIGEDVAFMDKEDVKRLGTMLSKMFDEVQGYPPAERGKAALEFARRVVQDDKIKPLEDQIDTYRKKLDSLDFSSEEELDKAIANGDDRVTGLFGEYKEKVKTIRQRIRFYERKISSAENELARIK